MKRLLLSITLATAAMTAQAGLDRTMGEWGSGGGNALVCFDRDKLNMTDSSGNTTTVNIKEYIKTNDNVIPDMFMPYVKSVEVFDLYEAKKRRGLNSSTPEILEVGENEDYYDYFERLGNRFKNHVWFMKGMIDEGRKMLPDSQIIFHEAAVEYQNDLGSVTLPSRRCVIATMAAQVNYNDFYEVHIDDRLFNHPQHSKQSKAVLILHELVYAIGRKHFEQTDSGGTRNLVRLLISYHESINEGTVAKTLYDLKYYAKNTHIPEFQYMQSEIVSSIGYGLFSGNSNLRSKMDFLFIEGEGYDIIKEIHEQYGAEGMGDPSLLEVNFLGAVETLSEGIARTNMPKVWLELRKKFESVYESIGNDWNDHVAEAKESFLSILQEETHITPEDFENLKGHADSFFFSYEFISEWREMARVFASNEDLSNVFQQGYQFLTSEVCTSGNVGPLPIPGDDSGKSSAQEDECYRPLKLNNVIPKE